MLVGLTNSCRVQGSVCVKCCCAVRCSGPGCIVRRCVHRQTGAQFAVKVVDVASSDVTAEGYYCHACVCVSVCVCVCVSVCLSVCARVAC